MGRVCGGRIALACTFFLLLLAPVSASTPSGLTYLESTWSNNDAYDGELVAINSDNTILASVHDGQVVLFNTSNYDKIASFSIPRVSAIEFSPDGTLLAVNKDKSAANQDTIKIIDIPSLTLLDEGGITDIDAEDIAWSQDGEVLAIKNDGKEVNLYRKSDLSVKNTLDGIHNTDIICIDYSSNNSILTGDVSGRYAYWNETGMSQGAYREYGASLLDCMFSPDGNEIILLDVYGNLKSSTIEGVQKNTMNVSGAMKVLLSKSGTKIYVAVQSEEFRGLITYDYDTFAEEKRTSFFHNINDIEIVENEYSQLSALYVAGGAGQVAVYLKNSFPEGYGEQGADLDGDKVPDIIDDDDDGDGIIDNWDDGIGCDAPEGIPCSKYPDLSKIRSINIDIGQYFTVTDTITLPIQDSSNIRNLSRITMGSDQVLTLQEADLFADSMCFNLDHGEIIELWNNSIVISNGVLGAAEVSCRVNSGMELVQSKDYTTQISFSIIIQYSYETEVALPVDISLSEIVPPTKGSISWIAASYPVHFSFTGDSADTIEIPLWWIDDELPSLTIEQANVEEQTLIEKTLDWAYHPVALVFYLGVITIGVLLLIRKDNKIHIDLGVDEDENLNDESDDYDESDDEYDDYDESEDDFDESLNEKESIPSTTKKRKMYTTTTEQTKLSGKKKIRSRNKIHESTMKTKRKRLVEVDVEEPVRIKKRATKGHNIETNSKPVSVKRKKVKKITEEINARNITIKKKVTKSEDQDVTKKKIKSSIPATDKPKNDKEEVIEVEDKNEDKGEEKVEKKKKRKPVRRKGKSTKASDIDEKKLQDNLVSDFLSED